MKKVFIITGEHSGDMHAGRVVEILKAQEPEIEIQGIGGDNLKKAGATIFCDHSKMSGFGLNLKMIIDHLGLENDVCEYILDEYKPDLVLLIDYGTFNLRVAKRLKGKGIKVLHYIPPQWRIKGIKNMSTKFFVYSLLKSKCIKRKGSMSIIVGIHWLSSFLKKLLEKSSL